MNKACPVVIRNQSSEPEILAFCHPLVGSQIVKGTIELGESLKTACERELFEESGIKAKSEVYLGEWDAKYESQIWGFYLMATTTTLSENWIHFTKDDGGLEFSFFWQSLNSNPDDSFHPLFKNAITYICRNL